ncbi:protein HRI1 [Cladorrhinum samala]|uniref:Protein HRI1 n=1 Tax=Cladorrhinum samala TaxID=585594 RepID=A0AAV9HKG6_9PEZI|nr:protein HRI1 [Cladorrhinum samala]
MGDISIRESIRWLPDPASEPTSTVVLTSPQRRYVDIRILKPRNEDYNPAIIPLSRLDWAIAGTSSSSDGQTDSATGEKYSHCEWRHWIDSRTLDVTNATDEGDNYSVPGDPSLTLEKGRMLNPATGVVTDYEEVWRSEEIKAAAPSRDDDPALLRGDDREPDPPLCVVMEHHGDESDGKVRRGMIIRLGRYCQTFLRKGTDVFVERNEWAFEGGWQTRVHINEGWLDAPVADALLTPDRLAVGEERNWKGDVWKVVEKS